MSPRQAQPQCLEGDLMVERLLPLEGEMTGLLTCQGIETVRSPIRIHQFRPPKHIVES